MIYTHEDRIKDLEQRVESLEAEPKHPTIQSVLAKAHLIKEQALKDLPESEEGLRVIMSDIKRLVEMQSFVDQKGRFYSEAVSYVCEPEDTQ